MSILTTKWKRVSVELSPQALDMIDRLLATGLYGLDRGEVCQRFIFEKLRTFERELPKLEATIVEVEQRIAAANTAIGALQISVRSENALDKAGIVTTRDLAELTLAQVKKLIGNKRNVDELRAVLREREQAFADDTEMIESIEMVRQIVRERP